MEPRRTKRVADAQFRGQQLKRVLGERVQKQHDLRIADCNGVCNRGAIVIPIAGVRLLVTVGELCFANLCHGTSTQASTVGPRSVSRTTMVLGGFITGLAAVFSTSGAIASRCRLAILRRLWSYRHAESLPPLLEPLGKPLCHENGLNAAAADRTRSIHSAAAVFAGVLRASHL